MTERIELRCCCDAHLIGTLPWGRKDCPYEVTYHDVNLKPMTFEVRRMGASRHFVDVSLDRYPGIKSNGDGLGRYHTYMALKSHEVPIEELRLIPGFREDR